MDEAKGVAVPLARARGVGSPGACGSPELLLSVCASGTAVRANARSSSKGWGASLEPEVNRVVWLECSGDREVAPVQVVR